MPNANTPYTAKRSPVLANPITTDSIFLSADNAAVPAFVAIPGAASAPGLSNVDGGAFRVRATGKITVSTSSTLIITLYYSAAVKACITAALGTTTGATITTASHTAPYSGNWSLVADFQWDYASKILNGYFYGVTGPTPALAALTVTTQLTAIDLSLPNSGFVMGAHLGTSGTTSTVALTNFSLEVL